MPGLVYPQGVDPGHTHSAIRALERVLRQLLAPFSSDFMRNNPRFHLKRLNVLGVSRSRIEGRHNLMDLAIQFADGRPSSLAAPYASDNRITAITAAENDKCFLADAELKPIDGLGIRIAAIAFVVWLPGLRVF